MKQPLSGIYSDENQPSGVGVVVPTLRNELIANGWRIKSLCDRAGVTVQAVKKALSETTKGAGLLAELTANKPTSGPSGQHKAARLAVMRIPSHLTEKLEAVAKAEKVTPQVWAAQAIERALARKK